MAVTIAAQDAMSFHSASRCVNNRARYAWTSAFFDSISGNRSSLPPIQPSALVEHWRQAFYAASSVHDDMLDRPTTAATPGLSDSTQSQLASTTAIRVGSIPLATDDESA